MATTSSYANESVLRPLNLVDFTLPTATYETPFLDVSMYSAFNIMAESNNAPMTVGIYHSTDSSGDSTKQLLESAGTVSVSNTLTNLGTVTVKSRFIKLTLGGNIGDVVNVQLVFLEPPLSLSTLTNVGGGVAIYSAPTSMKTLTSTDGSIILTPSATEIDFSVSSTPSPYQQIGDDITPISSSVNAQTSGDNTNTFDVATGSQINSSNTCSFVESADQCTIDSSIACSIIGPRTDHSSIISSNNSEIRTTSGSGVGAYCSIIASDSCGHGSSTPTEVGGTNSFIAASSSCNVNGSNCANNNISASLTCLIDQGSTYSTIQSCDSCTIAGSRQDFSCMMACANCLMANNGASGTGDFNVILGSQSCTIGNGPVSNGEMNAIIACNDTEVSYDSSGGSTNVGVIAFDNLPIGAGNAFRTFIAGGGLGTKTSTFSDSTILGSFWSSGHLGHFMFTDAAGGTTHSSSADYEFSVRSSGGVRFFTNTTNTTGVSMASGASAWAAVSDVNKKENIVEVDCEEVLKKVDTLPIYEYNYKGNDAKIKCIGPMAQDWHSSVLPLEKLDNGEDAKDKLRIEDMDMIGVCLASIKALSQEIKLLKETVNALGLEKGKEAVTVKWID